MLLGRLRAARLGLPGLTQVRVAALLGVTIGTFRAWEAARLSPTLPHLIRWCRIVGLRLAVVDLSGAERDPQLEPRDGETWEQAEMRRVAAALKEARVQRSMTQRRLICVLGVALSSLTSWECGAGHPRTLSLLTWADAVGCVIQVRPAWR